MQTCLNLDKKKPNLLSPALKYTIGNLILVIRQ